MKSPFALNRSFKKYSFALSLCVFVSALTATAGPADLDTGFGNGGKVLSIPFNSQQNYPFGMALQPDGKIVMVGGSGGSVGQQNFVIVRFNSDGSPDSDFGENGVALVPFGETAWATAVQVQADGRIVVGGSFRVIVNGLPEWDCSIARLNSNGTLDSTFDGDGKASVSFDLGTYYYDRCSTVDIANDGKIVIAGGALDYDSGWGRFVLARFNADGSLDASFGANGKRVNPQVAGLDSLRDLVLLPDGSMVVAGSSDSASFLNRIAIKFDSSGGTVWTHREQVQRSVGRLEGLYGVAALPDGKFIFGGTSNSRVFMTRLNADGTVDGSFVTPANMPVGEVHSVAIDSNGKIVAVYGNASGGNNQPFWVMRLNAGGSRDQTFGTDGIANTRLMPSDTDRSRMGLIQPDGKILVGGYSLQGWPSPTNIYFSMVRYRGGALIAEKPQFDYDGDRKSDVSVYRPSQGIWYLNQSTNGFATVPFGNATDRIVPADYDGDGKADIAVYRDGGWWIFQSSDSSFRFAQFGLAEDKPQPGDFDGDGRDDLAVFRPSSGIWYVFRSSDGGFTVNAFGSNGDIPQRGDYDDDGRADIAVFRPSTGYWYVLKSSGGTFITQFGLNGDVPVANDYDGDSKPDIAVWRPSNGTWYILRSSDNQYFGLEFGITTDVPVAADYDGDGRADIAVFRPSTGAWFQRLSTQGPSYQVFGLSTDRPTPGAYNP